MYNATYKKKQTKFSISNGSNKLRYKGKYIQISSHIMRSIKNIRIPPAVSHNIEITQNFAVIVGARQVSGMSGGSVWGLKMTEAVP